MSKRKDDSLSIDNPTIEIKNYPASLCKKHQSLYDDSTFLTLSFRFQNNWASFIIDDSCDIKPSMRRNGEELPDRFNVILGDPSGIRNVSLKSESGGFVNQPMYNRTIKDAILKSRKEYVKAIAI